MSTQDAVKAVLLKNRGVPCKVHKLVQDSAGEVVEPYERSLNSKGNFEFETANIRLTNSVLVDIEADPPLGWGDLDLWQEALRKKVVSVMASTLALCLGLTKLQGEQYVPDTKRATELMMDGELDYYSVIIGVAFNMAQGVSPEAAGKQLALALKELEVQRAEQEKAIQKQFEDAEKKLQEDDDTPTNQAEDTPSSNGRASSSKTEEALVSSGT